MTGTETGGGDHEGHDRRGGERVEEGPAGGVGEAVVEGEHGVARVVAAAQCLDEGRRGGDVQGDQPAHDG